MAMMYFRDINDVQISNTEANIWRIEAAVISLDHHPLICTGVALPLPLTTQNLGKISQREGYHALCLRDLP